MAFSVHTPVSWTKAETSKKSLGTTAESAQRPDDADARERRRRGQTAAIQL